MITQKDIWKIKKFYLDEGLVITGVILDVNDESYGAYIEVLEENGKITRIYKDTMEKNTFVKNLDSNTREMLESIGKEAIRSNRKEDKIMKEIQKKKEELQQIKEKSKKDIDIVRNKLEMKYDENNGLIKESTANEKIRKVLNKYATEAMEISEFHCHSVEFYGINEKLGKIQFNIPLHSIKYPNEGDFGGLIYYEYDNSISCYSDEKIVEEQAKLHLKNRYYSLKNLRTKAEELTNKDYKVGIRNTLQLGDKTTTLYMSVCIDIKQYKRNEETIEKIISIIKDLFTN